MFPDGDGAGARDDGVAGDLVRLRSTQRGVAARALEELAAER